MFGANKISLVIPCLNEARGLTEIFRVLPSVVDEVIIADNGSTDRTRSIAEARGARVLSVAGKGYGRCYQAALPEAKGDILVTMDGDASYPASEIVSLLRALEEGGYDFLSGCRFPLRDRGAMPLIKKISNVLISWLIRRLFGVMINDSQSGMWVFRTTLLARIMPRNPGMGFSQELKIRAWKTPGLRCAEFPVTYGRRLGEVKFRCVADGLRNLADALLLRFRRPQKET